MISVYLSSAVTFPLDMIKTRLHIQGQDHSVLKSVGHGAGQREAYRGMFKTAVGVGVCVCACVWGGCMCVYICVSYFSYLFSHKLYSRLLVFFCAMFQHVVSSSYYIYSSFFVCTSVHEEII